MNKMIWFLKDYISRHANPVDRVLHIIGVPEAFFGIYQLVTGEWRWGLFNLVLGYFWQWLGHTKFEHNEVGEVILMKHLLKKILTPTVIENLSHLKYRTFFLPQKNIQNYLSLLSQMKLFTR